MKKYLANLAMIIALSFSLAIANYSCKKITAYRIANLQAEYKEFLAMARNIPQNSRTDLLSFPEGKSYFKHLDSIYDLEMHLKKAFQALTVLVFAYVFMVINRNKSNNSFQG